MPLRKDLLQLQKHLDDLRTIGQLRTQLLRNNLRLIVTFYSSGFSCFNWDLTERNVSGILSLGIRTKIAESSNEQAFLESQSLYPFHFQDAKGIDQRDLFDAFKYGIKTCIKKTIG